ncbi:hypothetical protein HED60_05325 [Planctomycetales bacterium ZRK34]|nr:hypothetical protein HED60_05325 [Planctomycetales bacterium ZRK34]
MIIRLITLGLVCAVCSSTQGIVVYSDFSDTSGLVLNGAAASVDNGTDGVVLRLTPASGNQAGSIFSSDLVDATNFSTTFSFRFTESGGTLFDGNTETGADGMVFVVQPVSSSLGGLGQGIGFTGITPAVGVEFDTWHNSANNDPSSNHLGIDLNGSVNHGVDMLYTVDVSPDFNNGDRWFAWIDYDGAILEVRVSQTTTRPTDAQLTRDLIIPDIIGQDTAYIGFTAATGADWNNHDLIDWTYDEFNPIPQPAAVSTLLVAAVLCLRRRV